MTLYTVTQPNPPAGTDFQFVVPGNFLYDVIGITATLDNLGVGAEVTLKVTNGTTEVVAIPTGFPAPTGAGPYQYAWQPKGQASTETPDGTLTTIAVPELILPPGYTVGTLTRDFAPGTADKPDDYSGNGNNGVYVTNGGTQQFVTGAFVGDDALALGDAMSPNDAAVVANASPGMVSGSYTFVFWWKTTGVSVQTEFFEVWDTALVNVVFAAVFPTGQMQFGNASGGGYENLTHVGAALFDNAWHMYAFVYDAVTQHATIYIDGAVVPPLSDTAGTSPVGTAFVANIATDLSNVPQLTGALDEYAYFDVALSGADIAALHATAPDWSAWTATVLALIPTTAYHLDGIAHPNGQWSDLTLWWDDAYQQAFNPLNAYDFPGGIRLHYTQEALTP